MYRLQILSIFFFLINVNSYGGITGYQITKREDIKSTEIKPRKITIKGKYIIAPPTGEMVFLSEVIDKKNKIYKRIDSVAVKGKQFFLSSKRIKPGSYLLTNRENQSLPIFLDYGYSYITIDSFFSRAKIEGNQLDSLIKHYDAMNMMVAMAQIGYALKVKSYEHDGKKVPEEEVNEFIENFKQMSQQQKSLTREIGLRKDLAGAYVIVNGGAGEFTNQEINNAYALLPPSYKSTNIGKELKLFVDKLNSLAVGVKAPDFTQQTPEGKEIKLSDFIQGKKVVLIDFWASWCGPCRKENPNVVALYNEYKTKGFDIIGVSLDNEKENWLKAITDDRLTWTHVSDLKGWQNSVAQLYNVTAVPVTILLDGNGRIIAKNLRGEELRKKVSEICE